jgi:hypothetical protein
MTHRDSIEAVMRALQRQQSEAYEREFAARLEIVESGHFLLMSISAAEQAAPHYLWIG